MNNDFEIYDLNVEEKNVNPTDNNILNEYQKIRLKRKAIKEEYESKYGVLYSSDVNNDDKWTWNNNPWPWNKGGN